MSYSVCYWYGCEKFWGRAIGVIGALEAGGAKYEIKSHTERPSGNMFALPIVTFPEGTSMSQTPMILVEIGARLKLDGNTLKEKMQCKQSLMDVNDIFGEASSGKLKENPDRAKKWFALVEKTLSETKGFLVCGTPTVADFHAVFAFEWVIKCVGPECTTDAKTYPNIVRWWKALNETPAVKKMRDAAQPMIP